MEPQTAPDVDSRRVCSGPTRERTFSVKTSQAAASSFEAHRDERVGIAGIQLLGSPSVHITSWPSHQSYWTGETVAKCRALNGIGKRIKLESPILESAVWFSSARFQFNSASIDITGPEGPESVGVQRRFSSSGGFNFSWREKKKKTKPQTRCARIKSLAQEPTHRPPSSGSRGDHPLN